MSAATTGPDTLDGGIENDTIDGLAGDDLIDGGAGNDSLAGGDGNDTLWGNAGNDSLAGGAGSDTMNGGSGSDTLDGGEMLDRTNYTDINVLTFGSSATQGAVVNLQTRTVSNDGHGTADTVRNFGVVVGTAFNDRITGTDGGGTALPYEQFEGGAGDDTIDGGAFNNASSNRVTYSRATAAVVVDLQAGTATGGDGKDTLININQVQGSEFADTLRGTEARDDYFISGKGADTIDGRGGNDTARYDNAVVANLATGKADDGLGIDTLISIEGLRGSSAADKLSGGGNDAFEYFLGMGGDDTIDGVSGFDRVDYNTSTSAVTVNLATGTAQDGYGGVDTLRNIDAVRGSELGDTLTGNDGSNRLEGLGGNDILSGGAGVDTLNGGLGDDTLTGGAGNDVFTFSAANGGTRDVILDLAVGDNVYFGNLLVTEILTNVAGANLAIGKASINAVGSQTHVLVRYAAGDAGLVTVELAGTHASSSFSLSYHLEANSQIILGALPTEGDDNLSRGIGNDSIDGLGGNDTINGRGGDDTIRGGTGNDYISGGGSFSSGKDSIDGGAGNDIVAYNYDGETAGVTFVATSAQGFQVDPKDGQKDKLANIEELHVQGSAHADTLTGDGMRNYIEGRAGNDTLHGGAGGDTFAFAGNGLGHDRIVDFGTDDNLNFNGLPIQGLVTGSDPASLQLGQAMLAEPSSGATKLYVRTANGVDGVLTVTLDGSFDLSNFVIWNSDWGGSLDYSAGATSGDDENLWGGNGNEIINGLAGTDRIGGNEGNDTLTGGGGADHFSYDAHEPNGRDTITDFSGNDGIVVNGLRMTTVVSGVSASSLSLGQVLVQSINSGEDTRVSIRTTAGSDGKLLVIDLDGAFAAADFHVDDSSFVEWDNSWLRLDDGVATGEQVEGSRSNDKLLGGAGKDTLLGYDGKDTLDGGAGADILRGGKGNDTYSLDNKGDNIDGESSASAGGVDTVITGVDYSAAKDYVENLTAATGTASIDLTGNQLVNILTGNDGKNILDGAAGADVLRGGKGNDTYYLDNKGDNIDGESSASAGGVDTVITGVDYSAAKDYVENLTAATGTASIDLTGNHLANILSGNDGKNILDGAGGADVLRGGKGNDTYVIDNKGDNIDGESSASGGGIDLVKAGVSFSIAKDDVENLTLTGTAAINGTGNKLANTLTGNSGKNTLDGAAGADTLLGGSGADRLIGGEGADKLTGGSGADVFAYGAAADSTKSAYDTILDFVRGTDDIDLSGLDGKAAKSGHQDFTFIGKATAFGADATGQLRYEVSSGNVLLYGSTDADATAEFAVKISGITALSASDFLF